MFSIIINGFESEKDASRFIEWFKMRGEDDMADWFEEEIMEEAIYSYWYDSNTSSSEDSVPSSENTNLNNNTIIMNLKKE